MENKEVHPIKYLNIDSYSAYGICNVCYKLKKYCICCTMEVKSNRTNIPNSDSFPYICSECERPFCQTCFTKCTVCRYPTMKLCYKCERFICDDCIIQFNNDCIMCKMDIILEENGYNVNYHEKEGNCFQCKEMTESKCPKCKSYCCIEYIGNKGSCIQCLSK